MSEISKDDVLGFFNSQNWEIVDECDEPRWSVTATTDDRIRVAVDEPIEEPRMNNIIIEYLDTDVETVEEYNSAVDAVSDTDAIQVSVEDEHGLFMRAKHNSDVEMSDSGIVERLIEKDVSWGIRVSAVGVTEESSLDDIQEWVEEIREEFVAG